MKIYSQVGNKITPQDEPVLGRDMVKNDAGGYVFDIGDWKRLDRFLILGSEGGTYYVDERRLTVDSAQSVVRCIRENGKRVVNRTKEISFAGRAPKNDPALFVLAMCASIGDEDTRRYAFEVLPHVARIGTHLFNFVDFAKNFRGWGRVMKNGVANWYNSSDLDNLAYQMVKYQSRSGWSHRALIKLSHPKPRDQRVSALYRWARSGEVDEDKVPNIIIGFERAKKGKGWQHK